MRESVGLTYSKLDVTIRTDSNQTKLNTKHERSHMPATIRQAQKFARDFDITENVAMDCLAFLEFMPQINSEPFRSKIAKLDEEFKGTYEAKANIAMKDWLDLELGIKDENRRNKWSQTDIRYLFWKAVLDPCDMGRFIITEFVRVFGKKQDKPKK